MGLFRKRVVLLGMERESLFRTSRPWRSRMRHGNQWRKSGDPMAEVAKSWHSCLRLSASRGRPVVVAVLVCKFLVADSFFAFAAMLLLQTIFDCCNCNINVCSIWYLSGHCNTPIPWTCAVWPKQINICEFRVRKRHLLGKSYAVAT